MLPKPQRLRRAKDFALLSQKGRVVFGPFFTLRFRQSKEGSKVGFVCSAKIFKTAVARNRAKRRLREAARIVRPEWPIQMDLLCIAKIEVLTADFESIVGSFKRLFEKVPAAMQLPPRPRPLKARRKTSVIYRTEI